MKKKAWVIAFGILLIPIISFAEYSIPLLVQGTIGDYSKLVRKYEINGKIYQFPQEIILVDGIGNLIPFDRIRSGSVVKVLGKKVIGTSRGNEIVYNKIILLRQ